MLTIYKSNDNLTYTLFTGEDKYIVSYSDLKESLTSNELETLNKYQELTISDWTKSGAIMPIIKRTSAKRKDVAGKEKTLSKFLGIAGKANSPIITFKTKATFDNKEYRTKIQLVDLNKWRQGKYLYNMKVSEFKEILEVVDVKFDCTCKAFKWIGIQWTLTQVDSAIEPLNIYPSVWSGRKGWDSPSICKHLKGVVKLIKPNAGRILQALKDRYSTRFRK